MAAARRFLTPAWLGRRLGGVILADLAADDFAVEREGLQDDVEAAAVLMREHETEVEPVVVLAVAFDDRVCAMRRCVRLSLRHWSTPLSWLRCPAWAGVEWGCSASAREDRALRSWRRLSIAYVPLAVR